jgi:hypothetical protein
VAARPIEFPRFARAIAINKVNVVMVALPGLRADQEGTDVVGDKVHHNLCGAFGFLKVSQGMSESPAERGSQWTEVKGIDLDSEQSN